jgi:DNA-binding transcriptional regulator YdaS (Cro superfamily)
MTVVQEAASPLASAKAHRYLELSAHKDFLRDLLAASKTASQRDIARDLGISQPAVSQQLKTAQELAPVPEGFSGSSPTEICERYAAGLLTREQLIDELTRWDYPPERMPEHEWDDLIVSPPGGWAEVEMALWHELIDDELYETVLNELERQGR